MDDPNDAMRRLGANMLQCDECGSSRVLDLCYWVIGINTEDDAVQASPCCGESCGRKRLQRMIEATPAVRWLLVNGNHHPVT